MHVFSHLLQFEIAKMFMAYLTKVLIDNNAKWVSNAVKRNGQKNFKRPNRCAIYIYL